MNKLYELTEDYLAVMDMLQDDTIDIETIMDTLEGIEGEIEQKADNYAKIIRMLKGEIDVLKAEEERINSRRKTVENNVKRLEKSLQKKDWLQILLRGHVLTGVLEENYIQHLSYGLARKTVILKLRMEE